jgi:hypothetical protein
MPDCPSSRAGAGGGAGGFNAVQKILTTIAAQPLLRGSRDAVRPALSAWEPT